MSFELLYRLLRVVFNSGCGKFVFGRKILIKRGLRDTGFTKNDVQPDLMTLAQRYRRPDRVVGRSSGNSSA